MSNSHDRNSTSTNARQLLDEEIFSQSLTLQEGGKRTEETIHSIPVLQQLLQQSLSGISSGPLTISRVEEIIRLTLANSGLGGVMDVYPEMASEMTRILLSNLEARARLEQLWRQLLSEMNAVEETR